MLINSLELVIVVIIVAILGFVLGILAAELVHQDKQLKEHIKNQPTREKLMKMYMDNSKIRMENEDDD